MRALGFVPLACYLLMLLYALGAFLHLGHWPHYNNPDPKQLPGRLVFTAICLIALLGMISVLLAPLLYGGYRTLAAWRQWPVASARRPAFAYAAGSTLWIADLVTARNIPRASLTDWVLD